MSIRRLIGRNAQERAGSVTFNAPAIWTSPNRVVSVNVAGKGGTLSLIHISEPTRPY